MDDTDDANQLDQLDEMEYENEVFDPMLEALTALVNDTPGMKIGVTLNVAGGLVTGLLVNFDDWSREAAEESGNEIAEKIYTAWAADPSPEETTAPPGHVHLRDAFFVQGGAPFPTTKGFFWRGRLTEISGWTMGTLSAS